MSNDAASISRKLGEQAEAVCRHYLSSGRRQGRWWQVGDVHNTPGRSLCVRLEDSAKGRAGKWSDAATLEHGDLLDLIAANRNLLTLAETLTEAGDFLAIPRPEPSRPLAAAPIGSTEAARRLFAMGQPINGTLAERYLQCRGLAGLRGLSALRYHPNCWYRGDRRYETRDSWPALLAAVTDCNGGLTGLHRTWLDPDTVDKAPVATPRRSMGSLLGYGVRFGTAGDILLAGEGIETVLSLRMILPEMPMIAALSTGHLAGLELPPSVKRLYIARDDDLAGLRAAELLTQWSEAKSIETVTLRPAREDFNDDLRLLGPNGMAERLRPQLAPEDAARFLTDAEADREEA